jgi:hypothetical protein
MNTDAQILPIPTSLDGLSLAAVNKRGVEVQVPISMLLAVLPGDVSTGVANGATIASRLVVTTGTTPTVTLPSVSGSLRNVTVLNGASGNLTLDTPGSEKIFTGTADADTLVVATGKTATLWSEGTKWYHISNDA